MQSKHDFFRSRISKGVNKIIFGFIWKGKYKVKRSVSVSNIEDGGLKAPHLKSIIENSLL